MFSGKKTVAHLAWIALLTISGTSGAAAPGVRVQPKIAAKDDGAHVPGTHIPMSDGLLHVYELPVGHGYSDVIQCPNGDLAIADLGAGPDQQGLWTSAEVDFFLEGQFHLIKNIVISHYHADHYNFMPSVLTASHDLSSLENIHVTCTLNHMPAEIRDWLTSIQAHDKVRVANGGLACGPNGISCGQMNLCPGDPSVTINYMAANLGNCGTDNTNVDSIFFKLTHNEVSIILNGDFHDLTTDPDENGFQKSLVDYYGDEMKVTIFKLSAHGRGGLPNKPISNAAHLPKAIFVATDYSYPQFGGPHCDIINAFAYELGSLCKPLETNPASPDFCSVHPRGGVVPGDRLQSTYTCVDFGATGEFITVTNNEFAIYTTVPDASTSNVIVIDSDGVNWGFVNVIAPRLKSN
jgi:hypothetical protein